jgi:hypothetical protein
MKEKLVFAKSLVPQRQWVSSSPAFVTRGGYCQPGTDSPPLVISDLKQRRHERIDRELQTPLVDIEPRRMQPARDAFLFVSDAQKYKPTRPSPRK